MWTLGYDGKLKALDPSNGSVVFTLQFGRPASRFITLSAANGRLFVADGLRIQAVSLHGPPAITSLSPNVGSPAGGQTVTINGIGFTGASAVTFGGTPAAAHTVNSPTRITATTPARALGTVDVVVTTAWGSSDPTGAANDFTYGDVTRYEQTDTHIVKTGTWSNYAKTQASGASYGRSSTADASATVYFPGTRLDWVAMRGTTTGTAEVYVDGVGVTAVVFGAATASYNVTVWSTGTLPEGEHNVRTVRSSASAAGKYVTLDAVDIWGTISAPPARYEQTDTHIVKVGAWSNFTTGKASGGSYGRSSTSGPSPASATVYFTGTRLDWVAMKGTTTGIADVYVDGEKVATIDLAAASASYNVMVWSTGTCPNGNHSVQIVRKLGQRKRQVPDHGCR